jgi:hypothetical protein
LAHYSQDAITIPNLLLGLRLFFSTVNLRQSKPTMSSTDSFDTFCAYSIVCEPIFLNVYQALVLAEDSVSQALKEPFLALRWSAESGE